MLKATAIASYALAGLLTFGHVFNENYVEPKPIAECGERPSIIEDYTGWRVWYDCANPDPAFMTAFPATLSAAIWPAYWAGRAAIKVTKPVAEDVAEAPIEDERFPLYRINSAETPFKGHVVLDSLILDTVLFRTCAGEYLEVARADIVRERGTC